ncbi:MAG: PAS domain S-box protein, partial [Bacteroidota bacterium]
ALAIADNKYKNIIENLNEGLIITDKQGKITFISKKMVEITGFSEQEALGKVAHQLFLPKEKWVTFEQKMKHRLEGKSERYEVEQLRKDGTTWYSVMNASPYWSPSGEIIGAITAITDITEQKKIEHLNEYNRALMQKIIDTALDAVVSFNRDNEITHWNNQAEVIFGYTKREAIGKHLSNLIVSEQFEKIQEYGVKDYLATGKGLIFNQRVEVTAKDRGGKEFPVELAVTPVSVKGEQMFSAFIRDISKQKEDQRTLATINQRFATLIENMQAGILLEDENRNIVLVNEKFCEMFRVLVEPSQMLGLDCIAITEESKNLFKEEQGFVEGISKIIQANQMVLAEEMETKDNRILERDYIPIHINEQYLGHLWQYRDVSEKQQQQRELVEAKNRAEEAVVAKQNFLSTMSHEVRTPMNAILGMNKLLAKTTLSTQQRKYTAAIQDAGEHLLVIINDILDTSKIEAGKIELEHIHFDVVRLFDQLHLTLSHKAEEKGIGFFFELDERIHPVLVGDPVRLNQVLVNLLSNAVKFTDQGQVRFYGKLVSRMPDINVVSFEVKDTGKGIAPDKLADIFNRFSQEDTSISRKYGGTGLGLSIARQLVGLFGGELEVESEVGVGTTFRFIVAFKTGEKEALVKEEENTQAYDLSELRVLLVEDNPMNQLYAKTVLDDFSTQVTVAQDGTEAIKYLKEEAFDVVLMDMQMPVMNGLEATEIIRKELRLEVPIIALTANAIKGDSEKCFEVGMNDYLSKPFEPNALQEKIGKLLRLNMPTNESAATHQLYNLDELEVIAGENSAFIEKMVQLFITQTPQLCKEIRHCFEENELEKMSEIAHKLKASVRTLKITEAGDLLDRIEDYKIQNLSTNQLNQLITSTTKLLTTAVDQLQQQFSQLS